MRFPSRAGTALSLVEAAGSLPTVMWAGFAGAAGSSEEPFPLVRNGPGMPLLGEHARMRFGRPHLRGHRPDGTPTGWSPWFRQTGLEAGADRLRIAGEDPEAGLEVLVEFEALPGGALRGRCQVTNTGATAYSLEGLELCLPVDDDLVEVLDFTGRHEGERNPQRHALTDGLWLRESRGGRPGLESATMVVAGTAGFGTTHGRVLACHVAWSGNSVLRVERTAANGTTLGGGELLLPGEVNLASGEGYATPWVFFVGGEHGLDDVSAALHAWQRTLPAHPGLQPILLNVWEAVYFDHSLDRLLELAERAAAVGVERFVLDDGWFHGRRDDHAGLGDWWVDETVWPEGLAPLVDRVRQLGMEFGLWFEPEMVNRDSDLFREHPDWVLRAGERLPLEHRQQQVLDLSRAEVRDHLFERIDAVLTAYDIAYVKWDHNRQLVDAGGAARGFAPVVRAQTLGFYELLDRLRAAHPTVAWESCASGGGRIDLGVLERVQRFWISDLTDALQRQHIQRWTQQLIAPEYAGAHVSAPVNHSSWRTLTLDFRCATAMFGAFGIEWDLTTAGDEDLAKLTEWVDRFKRFRPLLHSGRVVRPETPDPSVLLHGVVTTDEALIAHVQLDEATHNRGVTVRVPGLEPEASYDLVWEGPVIPWEASESAALTETGPTQGRAVTGATLATRGFWMPRMRPEQITLVWIRRAERDVRP